MRAGWPRRLDDVHARLLAPAAAADDAPTGGHGRAAPLRVEPGARRRTSDGSSWSAATSPAATSTRPTSPDACATPFGGDPWPRYRRLRTGDPSLFSAYLDLGSSPETGRPRALLSASPEPFLSVDQDGVVASDPIKGTRPRGRDRAEDRALACELLASAKDRAENVMIVDVLRNDLGRVCEPGHGPRARGCAGSSGPPRSSTSCRP